jgi:choice-of-anchor B domain-containing protein
VHPRPYFRAFLLLAASAVLLAAAPGSNAAASPVSRNMTLLSHLDSYAGYSACWSYVHHDGREYAVLGTTTGTSIVRLTDPANPVEVKFISGPPSDWREMKQYRNWIYVCSEGAGTGRGIQIISMENPDDPRLVKTYRQGFDTAHTVTIDTTRAVLYCNGTSIGMVALSLANPTSPTELGVFTGFYVHDLHVRGTLGFAAAINNGFESILDLTNPGAPVEIRRFQTPANFTHNSWTTEDGRYLYVTEENAGGKPKVYDIQNLTTPALKYTFGDLTAHIGHNVHIKGDTAFVSYYTAGVRLYDISDPEKPVEFAYYDTFSGPDGGFDGVWEVAPYFPSGIFIVSDISNGLFVLRASGDYGIVRGTVRSSEGGAPVTGATIHDHTDEGETTTGADGVYAIAAAVNPEAHLEAHKFGHEPAEATFSVVAGGHYNVDFVAPLLPSGVLRGTARRTSDNAVLGGAAIEVVDTPLSTATAAAGWYQFNTVPVGVYTVRSDRPGYLPSLRWGTVAQGAETVVDFALAPALYHDDAEIDRGWTLGDPSDNATTGVWIRAEPIGSSTRVGAASRFTALAHEDAGRAARPFVQGAAQHPSPGEGHGGAPGEVQPSEDNTPEPGITCFVTGNSLGGVGDNDVDGGKTTLTSPVVNLAGVADPRVVFWRWYSNNAGGAPGEDPFITLVSNNGGSTWTAIDSLFETRNFWERVELRVLDYFPTPGPFRVRFVAQDLVNGSVVEAAIDDLMYYSGSQVTAAEPSPVPTPAVTIGAPRPTPTSDHAEVALTLARPEKVIARIYDARGRELRTLRDAPMPAGRHVIRWDGRSAGGARAASGIYWMRIEAGSVRRSMKIVLVR